MPYMTSCVRLHERFRYMTREGFAYPGPIATRDANMGSSLSVAVRFLLARRDDEGERPPPSQLTRMQCTRPSLVRSYRAYIL